MGTNGKNKTSQCERCFPAHCCNYFSFEIDAPEDRDDYDTLLWKLAHDKISMYIYRNGWFIMVHTRCNFLSPENKCMIYHNRPKICRDHSVENCEFVGEDFGFTEHFKSYDDLLKYIEENTPYRFKQEATGIRANCP